MKFRVTRTLPGAGGPAKLSTWDRRALELLRSCVRVGKWLRVMVLSKVTFVFFNIFTLGNAAVTRKHSTPTTCLDFIIFNSIVAYWWHAVQKQLPDIPLQLGPSKPHQNITKKQKQNKKNNTVSLSFSWLTSGETKLGPFRLLPPFFLFFFFVFWIKKRYIEFIYYNTQQKKSHTKKLHHMNVE